jgi:hypothetical protein
MTNDVLIDAIAKFEVIARERPGCLDGENGFLPITRKLSLVVRAVTEVTKAVHDQKYRSHRHRRFIHNLWEALTGLDVSRLEELAYPRANPVAV